MMSDLHFKSIAELSAGLQAGDFSSVELTQHFLDRIERFDGELNALVTLTKDQALAQAEAADARIRSGDAGPLTGIPILHKDIFCTEGVKTSCGSRMLDNFISPYDATVVTRLKDAGVVMLGKTNMDEFAMGSSNETSFYGPVKNPGIPNVCPAALPAVRPPAWQHAWAWPPPARTPVAPSASPPPCAASPASNPPTGGYRAMA